VVMPLARQNITGFKRMGHRHAHWYEVEGVTDTSDKMHWKFGVQPIHAHAGKYEVWYNEDLTNGTVGDNAGTACFDIEILGSPHVCVHALGDKPATFSLPEDMSVSEVIFTHKSGGLTCRGGGDQSHRSNFGCDHDSLGLVITGKDRKEVLMPLATQNITGFKRMGHRHAHWYEVEGVTDTSREMHWKFGTQPVRALAGEYDVWYNEDLTNGTVRDNAGTACYDVKILGSPTASAPTPPQPAVIVPQPLVTAAAATTAAPTTATTTRTTTTGGTTTVDAWCRIHGNCKATILQSGFNTLSAAQAACLAPDSRCEAVYHDPDSDGFQLRTRQCASWASESESCGASNVFDTGFCNILQGGVTYFKPAPDVKCEAPITTTTTATTTRTTTGGTTTVDAWQAGVSAIKLDIGKGSCADNVMIKKEDECKAAAEGLGLKYVSGGTHRDHNKPTIKDERPGGCYSVLRGSVYLVYFNDQLLAGTSIWRKANGVCHSVVPTLPPRSSPATSTAATTTGTTTAGPTTAGGTTAALAPPGVKISNCHCNGCGGRSQGRFAQDREIKWDGSKEQDQKCINLCKNNEECKRMLLTTRGCYLFNMGAKSLHEGTNHETCWVVTENCQDSHTKDCGEA
jgi:hypothetical protein